MDESGRDDLPLLHGARIDLRGFREDDLQDFFAMHSDPKVARYGSHPAFTELSQATERFERELHSRDSGRALAWVIADRKTDRLMGSAALFAIDREQGRAELGYALRPSHWGKGFALEAVRLVLGHAFDTLNLRRLEADIDPRNSASCKLAERLGFVREGLLRERWKVAGEICDAAFYGLLASDWRRGAGSRSDSASAKSPWKFASGAATRSGGGVSMGVGRLEQQKHQAGGAPTTQVGRMRAAVEEALAVAPGFLRGDVDADHMAKTMVHAVKRYVEQERAAGSDEAPGNAEAEALRAALSELMGCGSGYLADRCDAACVARTMTQMVHEFGTH